MLAYYADSSGARLYEMALLNRAWEFKRAPSRAIIGQI